MRISKYKNIFAKGYTPNWSEEVFVTKKLEMQFHGHMSLMILMEFYEKELQKIDQQEFRIDKVIKEKGDKLYVRWKGSDNSFNSWIDKKDFV